MPLLVPLSVGELFDKISILEIKATELADPAKRANVLRELDALDAVRAQVEPVAALEALTAELEAVNRRLWAIEDDLRRHERDGQFDDRFIELARSVYRNNDRRAALKRQINELTSSDLIEEKSYL
jgi:hypothetical protein